MKKLDIRTMLLASTVVAGSVGMTPAMAQTTTGVPDTAAELPRNTAVPQAETGEESAEVVITGSRIRSANVESVSPITTVTSEEFAARGVVRTEDLVNALPQVFAAQGANNSNEATGTAQVDLRGLSPSRTLVLVNGRRLAYGSPKAIPSDVNQVPAALIETVEVLTGGASAVYGSDAIAGVVNFKLIDDFEGLRLNANLSVFQHNNDRQGLRDLLDTFEARVPGAYPKPDETVWNGFAQDYSAVVGSNMADGRGNVTAYASYRKVNSILQKDFDYSACALGVTGTNGDAYSCSGSSNNAPANLSNAGATRIPGLPTSFRVAGGQFVAGSSTYNFAPANYYQRPDERYAIGATAHYELSSHFVPYVELSFMDDRSISQIAPGNNSGGINLTASGLSGINCDNPFLSAQQATYLCTSQGLSTGSTYDAAGNYVAPLGIAQGITIARRNVEGGNRQEDNRHTTYRIVGGLRGELTGPFRYDIFAQYSNVGYKSRFVGDANRVRTNNAFYAVRNRAGQIVCKINADATTANDDSKCAPLDYFGASASQQAVDYIAESKSIVGDTSLTNIVASVDGNLGAYGIQSPWANEGVGIAFGVEYRKNYVDYQPDETYQNAGSPELPVTGSTVAKEAFGELIVPILSDKSFFKLLSFEGAYRYSDYDTGFKTDTYKLGVNWSPVQALRLRGSYQRAARAPNVIELFSSQYRFEVNLTRNANGSFDPCAGDRPFATRAQCANTGVTNAQYGFIVDNTSGQFGSLVGGNTNLQPETAKTYSLGAVFQPDFVRNLTVSVDYFNIKVDDLVGSVNPNLSLTNCLGSGDPFFCSLIQRDPNTGSLFQGDLGYFKRFNVNTGSLETKGIDVAVDYRMNFDAIGINGMGSIAFNLVGTYLNSYKTTPLPNSPASDVYECKGLYAGLCGRPRPEWRHKLLTAWTTPWNLDASLTWRYVSSVDVAQTSSQPVLTGSFAALNKTLNSRSYFDVSLAYEIREKFKIRLGVNNILDKDPPLTTTTAIEDGGNGNTYPQFYDATGRYIFVGASIDF